MSKVANMLNMVKILEDGKIHTIQDLADELEVSTRMIRARIRTSRNIYSRQARNKWWVYFR